MNIVINIIILLFIIVIAGMFLLTFLLTIGEDFINCLVKHKNKGEDK